MGDGATEVATIDELARSIRTVRERTHRELAFARLVEMLEPSIRATISQTGCRDFADQGAVITDVREAIWNERTGRRRGQCWHCECEAPTDTGWNGRSSYKSYASGIARHTALDHLRRSRRRHTRELPYDRLPDIENGTDFVAQLSDGQLASTLLARLRPKERGIVVLHGVAGMTFPEIAAHLDLGEPQIKACYYRALSRLQAEVDSCSDLVAS